MNAPDSRRARFRSRFQVILSGVEPESHATAERWLIQLRWVAIAGMLATTAVAKAIVPALATAPLLFVFALVALMNLAWTRALDEHRPKASGARFVPAQIASDVLALSVVLWLSGGTSNPFAKFISFQIAIAGLLCSGRVTLGILLLTLGSVGVLSQAPPLSFDGSPLAPETVRTLGTVVSLAALGVFLAVFVYFYARRLDALRAQSARNEKLAMLGRLVGGMSHELATPLATILLAGKELVHATAGKDPEAEALAATVAGEAQRASDIIVLMKGQVRPDELSEKMEVASFVRAFVGRELDRLRFRGERVVDARGPITAATLRAGLEQVLRNLLRNAVQAAASSPKPRVAVTVGLRGGMIEISVEDSGPGFAPDIVPTLGEPFQTTKQGEGMGLGLYVSSVLAERMSGELRVENVEGSGARVTLRFRRAKAAKPGRPKPGGARTPRG